MKLVLLGDPVTHSRSPAIHTAALKASGLDGSYQARRVDEAGVRSACDELRRGELDGANVTMPHKRVAAAHSDRLCGEAVRIGAVNTLVPDRGEVVGHTTDVEGIFEAWSRMRFPSDVPVLVLGGGGAAAAALLALQERHLAVATRRPGAGADLAARIGVGCRELSWGMPLADAVVVNATPLGMQGEDLPHGVVAAASGLFDMVYGGPTTPALRAARRSGIPATDGLPMLVAQAARSFELWTGLPAPREVMEEAARRGR